MPIVQIANEWKALADKAKVPISKFVIELVENSLEQEADSISYQSRAELLTQLQQKNDEIDRLQKKDNRLIKMLAVNLDKELKRYRAKPFADDSFQGSREFDKDSLELLRKTGSIDSDKILHSVGISPKDIEMVKAVNRQLQALQSYKLVEPTVRGWMWIG